MTGKITQRVGQGNDRSDCSSFDSRLRHMFTEEHLRHAQVDPCSKRQGLLSTSTSASSWLRPISAQTASEVRAVLPIENSDIKLNLSTPRRPTRTL